MVKYNEELVWYVGLTFRILFYAFFLSQILIPVSEQWMKRNIRFINILIIVFAIGYISYPITYFDGKNRGGGPEVMLFTWIVLFCYIGLYVNKLQFLKFNIRNQSIKIWTTPILIILICGANAFFNYHRYRGTWHGDFISESVHGYFSALLPLFALFFKNIKPYGIWYGILLIVSASAQFYYGLTLSMGRDGYLSDDTEFSIVFLSNTAILFVGGIINLFYSIYQSVK